MLFAVVMVLGLAAPAVADQVVDGSTGPGSVYRLVRPSNWNGILLLYAHGTSRRTCQSASRRTLNSSSRCLQTQGFAVAVSSFSRTVGREGRRAAHAPAARALYLEVRQAGSRLRRGSSMGGLIAIRLIETWPDQFAGVLPACAVTGGLARQVDFMANVRVLFLHLLAAILGLSQGTAVDVPAGIQGDPRIFVNPAIAAMTRQPCSGRSRLLASRRLPSSSQAARNSSNPLRLRSGEPLGLSGDPLNSRTGALTSTTRRRRATGALNAPTLAFINANVQRFSGTPAGARTRWSTTTCSSRRPPHSSAHAVDVPAIRSSQASTAPCTGKRSRQWQRRLARPAFGPRLRGRLPPLHLHAAGAYAGLLRPRRVGRGTG